MENKEELSTKSRATRAKGSLGVIACLLLAQSTVFISSCASQDKIRAQQPNDNMQYVESHYTGDTHNTEVMSRNNIYYGEPMTNEEMRAWGERTYVHHVEYKIQIQPSQKDKYNQELQQEKDLLQKGFEARVNERSEFLLGFYKDLYHLNNKDFTKQYKKFCSKELLLQLKSVYHVKHGIKGYDWSVFTDNKLHDSADFKCTYLDGNPTKVENKNYALYMFGDSVKQETVQYRFTNEEDKWFRLDMGQHNIMVQVDGLSKYLSITGVINPYQNYIIKAKKRHPYTDPHEYGSPYIYISNYFIEP